MQSETDLILVGRPTGRLVMEPLDHMPVIKLPGRTGMLPDNVSIPERLMGLLGLPQDILPRVTPRSQTVLADSDHMRVLRGRSRSYANSIGQELMRTRAN